MTDINKTKQNILSISKEKFVILFLVILGCSGFAIYILNQKSVFPSASINLVIPKADILDIAQSWATSLGYKKDQIIKSVAFNVDDDAKTFLEYNLGNTDANELMKEQIPVFYWSCYFRKEFDQEKMDVNLSPQGSLIYFDHNFPNDLAINTIDHNAALSKAQAFVLKQTSWSKEDCKLVEDNTDSQLHRKDYDFVWEYQKIDLHGAKLRASASVSGNILSSYYKYLHLPDTWNRQYQNIRSYNELLHSIASVFYFLLYIAAIFVFFHSITIKDIRWRFVLSCAGILTAICLLDNLNNLQASLINYDSKQSYIAFLCTTYFGLFASLPFTFVLIAIITSAAEKIYRLTFPQHLPINKWISPTALRSRYVNLAILIGYASFGISLGYQICYYALGKKINFWCPLGVDDYYQILTSSYPWFGALSLGVFASASEECLYRVLMLGLVQKLFNNFWIANILQAVAWGFMHSNYPQQPCYARGIELSLEGIFWGWILKRYGLLACLISHYLFDVLCEVIPLLSAPLLSLKFSALIPLLPFLILFIISTILRLKKGAPPEDKWVNQIEQIPVREATKKEPVNLTYNPLKTSTRKYLILAISILFSVCILWQPHNREIYEGGLPLQIDRQKAIDIAHKYLSDKKFDLTGYWSSAVLANSLPSMQEQFQYIYEKLGFKQTDSIVRTVEDPHIWNIRFFRPSVAEEYGVNINHDGSIRNMAITRLEDASGARLTEKEAKIIGQDFIEHLRSIYAPLTFANAEVKDRSHRTDYSFEFKSTKYKVADADLIVGVDVLGDLPSSISHSWKIPDEWKWQRTKLTLQKALIGIAVGIFSLGLFVLFIWWLIQLLGARLVEWRPFFILGGILLAVINLLFLNSWPIIFSFYPTTMPVSTYIVVLLTGILIMSILAAAFAMFLCVITWSALKQLNFSNQALVALNCLNPKIDGKRIKIQFNVWLDALLLASTYELACLVFSKITAACHFAEHSISIDLGYSSFDFAVNCFSPLISQISELVSSAFSPVIFVAIIAAMFTKFGIRKDWQVFACIFLLSSLLNASVMLMYGKFYWQEYLFNTILMAGHLLLFWLFLRKAIQPNPLSLILAVFISTAIYNAKIFIQNGYPLYSLDTIFSIILAISPVLFLAYLTLNLKRFQEV